MLLIRKRERERKGEETHSKNERRRNKLYRDNPEMEHEETDASLKKELGLIIYKRKRRFIKDGEKKSRM